MIGLLKVLRVYPSIVKSKYHMKLKYGSIQRMIHKQQPLIACALGLDSWT